MIKNKTKKDPENYYLPSTVNFGDGKRGNVNLMLRTKRRQISVILIRMRVTLLALRETFFKWDTRSRFDDVRDENRSKSRVTSQIETLPLRRFLMYVVTYSWLRDLHILRHECEHRCPQNAHQFIQYFVVNRWAFCRHLCPRVLLCRVQNFTHRFLHVILVKEPRALNSASFRSKHSIYVAPFVIHQN